MAQKGFDLLVSEKKDAITKDVNDALQAGIPVSVVHLMIENIAQEIRGLLDKNLTKQKSDYEQQLEIEANQVVYEEEPASE